MVAGAGQLIIFYGLLFYLYKGKLKDAIAGARRRAAIKFARLRFWCYLLFGTLFVVAGALFFVRGDSAMGNFLMVAGAGQLIIFYGLLFYLYKGKLKDAIAGARYKTTHKK